MLDDGGFAVRLQHLDQAGDGKDLARGGGGFGVRRLAASGEQEKQQAGEKGYYSHGG